MKKNKIIYTILVCLSLLFVKVNAANMNIYVNSSASRVIVNNTFNVTITVSSSEPLGSWEYTLDYNPNYFKLVSGQAKVVDYGDGKKTSVSYHYTFRALKSGSASIGTKAQGGYSYGESKLSINAGRRNINMITNEELMASYSKDNNLKSFGVQGYEISPKFSKDVTSYTVNVPNTVMKVKLTGEVNDSRSSVNGLGEKDVSEGDNKFDVTVTAENGGQKKYSINVVVKDPNPIVVTTKNNKKGTIIKRESNLKGPDTFKPIKIKINNEEVPAFTSDITNLVLVGLKVDGEHNNLYVYNEKDNSYTLYNEVKFSSIRLLPLDYDKFPNGFIKGKEFINDYKFTTYKFNKDSHFSLFYGLNIETGKENIYQYNDIDKNISIYNNEEVIKLREDIDNDKKIMFVLGCQSLLLIILIIVVMVSKNKMKKKYSSYILKLEDNIKKHKKINKEVVNKDNSNKDNKKEESNTIKIEKLEATKSMDKVNKGSKKNGKKKKNK